jgi:hypothetical protein
MAVSARHRTIVSSAEPLRGPTFPEFVDRDGPSSAGQASPDTAVVDSASQAGLARNHKRGESAHADQGFGLRPILPSRCWILWEYWPAPTSLLVSWRARKNGCDKFGPRFRGTEKVTVIRRVRVEELGDSLGEIDRKRSYAPEIVAVIPKCKKGFELLLIGAGDRGRPLVSKENLGPFGLLGDLVPSCEQARVFRYGSRNGYSQKLSQAILLNSNFGDSLTTRTSTCRCLIPTNGSFLKLNSQFGRRQARVVRSHNLRTLVDRYSRDRLSVGSQPRTR